MSISPDDILAEIPGWENASFTRLSGGYTNRTWHVVHGERAAVLKIDDARRKQPFNTRSAEAIVQTSAAKAGLAAKVILAKDGMYLTEYAEGTVWEWDSFATNPNLELLAAALKRVHSLPRTGRTFDTAFAAKRYANEIRDLHPGIIARCSDIVTSMRKPQNLCCCHNDLVAENMITTPDLMFLDWEYACDNDPFYDLATVVEYHELKDSQTEFFLDAYFDGDGQRWRESLEEYRKLYLALLLLWTASRPKSDEEDVAEVVGRFVTSCF